MRNFILVIILIQTISFCQAEERGDTIVADFLRQTDSVFFQEDTISTDLIEVDDKDRDKLLLYSHFKPDPVKAIWLGAILPGYGQIVNKKYWKLPIVYGGFLGFAYAINWNSRQYSAYKNAYRDIIDTNPNTTSYMDVLPRGYTIASFGGEPTYTNYLKTRQDSFRYYRDLSVILSVVYYALVVVEAYVDAQLYDFDVSTELAKKVELSPIMIAPDAYTQTAWGVQLSVRL